MGKVSNEQVEESNCFSRGDEDDTLHRRRHNPASRCRQDRKGRHPVDQVVLQSSEGTVVTLALKLSMSMVGTGMMRSLIAGWRRSPVRWPQV